MTGHPYAALGERAYWRTAVGRRDVSEISDLWRPAFAIGPRMRTVTFGSCFAQHFSRALAERGFAWVNEEEGPADLPADEARALGYGVFSARTGNIYTASMLLQWVRWADGSARPPDELWAEGGRVFDPFRPRIEPGGFEDEAEMLRSREAAIAAFRRCIAGCRLFVFTLGLTESWWHGQARDHEYPLCPGTAAGRFDPDRHVFLDQGFGFVRRSLTEAIERIRALNPKARILLTVSPVPLAATASGGHVLVATSGSKAVLRAVAGETARRIPRVDYFPSYEVVSAPPFRGRHFEEDMRSVSAEGVARVMDAFFAGIGGDPAPVSRGAARGAAGGEARADPGDAEPAASDLVCEEELLDAMRRPAGDPEPR